MKYDWVCMGVTHEYWEARKVKTTQPDCTSHQLHSLWIDDREDGGCKSDKSTRDKRLLEAGMKDPNEPQHLKVRYMFYLAQTLFDLHEYPQAINWYRQRIAANGWLEEVFYSQMKIGFCY